jgi:hypothetical protein
MLFDGCGLSPPTTVLSPGSGGKEGIAWAARLALAGKIGNRIQKEISK